jgi:hypothetical protein
MHQETEYVKKVYGSMVSDAATSGTKRRWGEGQRIEFIELRAFWEGTLNRGDIRDQFGVSAPQASADIATYLDLAPGNLVYDTSRKCYLASDDFAPRLVTPSAEAYLRQVADASSELSSPGGVWIGAIPAFAATPIPGRVVDARVLREILKAMRGQASFEIFYQSMNPSRPSAEWRRITPHSLATDSQRWHTRAFCHEDQSFKDFLLPRIRDVRSLGQPGALSTHDLDWNTIVEVELIPNPELSREQQSAVDWDYNMGGRGVLAFEVRRALLYYFCRRLRLDVAHDRPAERPVVLANPAFINEQRASAKGMVTL